ncbi:MAG TPA: chemotaxis protein CheW [Negativicutes bacterium]|nr:chemotaxis protein CheW [Negativicutes bacterium]
MAQENLKLVDFSLTSEDRAYEYGIPIEQVLEITRPSEVTKLPGMPNFIEGIMNLRGNVIPVMDLKKRFGLGTTVKQDETRIVVVKLDQKKCGVIVDEVLEIIPLLGADIEDPPAFAGGVDSNFIIGIGKVDQRLIIALDMRKILTARETEQLSMAE